MRLTASGIFFLVIGLTLGVAAYRFSVPGFLPVGILLVLLVVFSVIVAFLSGGRLKADVSAAAPRVDGIPLTRVGADLELRVRLSNTLPVPLSGFYVEIEGDTGFGNPQGVRVPGVKANGTITVDATFTPSLRGIHGIRHVTVAIEGPFNLASIKKTIARNYRIAVAPPELPLSAPGYDQQARTPAESARMRRGNETRDFYTREYVPGDDLRHVHWKTTARLGELVVRQEAQEDQPSAIVYLHTPDSVADARFDMLTAAALTAVKLYVKAGYDTHVIFGSRVLVVPAGAKTNKVDYLAARAVPEAATLPAQSVLRSVSEILLCLPGPDTEVALPPLRRTGVHRWYLSDISDETVEAMNFSGLFGGDYSFPEAWNLRRSVNR